MERKEDDKKDSIVEIITASTGIKSRNALLTVALGIGGYCAKFVQQTADDIRQIRVEVAAFVATLREIKEQQKDHEDRLRLLEFRNATMSRRKER